MKNTLRRKLILTILSVGVLSVVIGLIATAWSGTTSLRQALGDNFEGLAHETAQKVDIAISREVDALQHVTHEEIIKTVVKMSNQGYEGRSEAEIVQEIQEADARWGEANLKDREKLLSKEGSSYLEKISRIKSSEKRQIAKFVTDNRGIVVASANTLISYTHAHENWWKKTIKMGADQLYISDVYQNENPDVFVFDLAIPIFDGQSGNVIGALKVVFGLKRFLTPLIEKTRFGQTGHAMLIDSEGIVLACPILPTGMHIPQRELIKAVTSMDPGWIIAEDDAHGGKNSIVGFSLVEGVTKFTSTIGGKRWHSFIRQAPEETYIPIYALIRSILLSGGFSIGFVVIIGFVVARRLVEPIHLLHIGAEEIGKGKLDHRLDIRTGDEIEQLAEEFNTMAEKLKESHTDLEEKVRDRTMELRETVERLQEMDRLKSEFLSNMSHELRTPLTSIIGFSEILLDQVSGDLNSAQKGYVQNMFNSGQNLLEIISNLLDLSKIRSGKMQIHLRPCRIEDVLNSVTTTITPLMEKKHQHLEREIEVEVPQISADAGKLRQILLNLLSNAVKFTGEGGTIKIRGRVVALEGESYLEISVIDTGVGIRQNDLNMIFDEFRQVDASYTRDNPGTGLGLPITKHFVEMHGGRIRVKSTPGSGSTFTFSLPISMPLEKQGKTITEIKKGPQRASMVRESAVKEDAIPSELEKDFPKILVVEDDRQTSELIGLYLTREGYQVVFAYDGEDAVEKARTVRPFAITLDIMLPGKDGWQVLEELQSYPETRDIPVIILSMVEDPKSAFSLGAVDYLLKPLDRGALLKSLSKLDLVRKVKVKPVTILLIEHNPEVSEVIKGIIGETAFGVISATEIEEGITLALEGQPDIILLGLTGFSDQDGIDLPQKLMKYRIIKDIPIIIYIQDELTSEIRAGLEGEIRKILRYDGQSIKDELLSEIKKYEKLYPDKARMIDGLTGLYNERYLKSRLADEVDRAFRYKRTFSLLVTNVDHFRGYNGRNGVEKGDKVLRNIAASFRQNLRSADPISRIGGSTFMILMTETIQRPGILVAEKLRRLVESLSFPSQDGHGTERLTISVGVSTFLKDARTGERMIGKVLDALERAKEEGGNRVVSTDSIPKEGSDI